VQTKNKWYEQKQKWINITLLSCSIGAQTSPGDDSDQISLSHPDSSCFLQLLKSHIRCLDHLVHPLIIVFLPTYGGGSPSPISGIPPGWLSCDRLHPVVVARALLNQYFVCCHSFCFTSYTPFYLLANVQNCTYFCYFAIFQRIIDLTCLIIVRESTLWNGPSCLWFQNMIQ